MQIFVSGSLRSSRDTGLGSCNAHDVHDAQLLVLDTRQGNYNAHDAHNAQLLVFDTRQGNYNADTPWIRPWRLLSSIHAGQVLLT